jgi:hypothetical protein
MMGNAALQPHPIVYSKAGTFAAALAIGAHARERLLLLHRERKRVEERASNNKHAKRPPLRLRSDLKPVDQDTAQRQYFRTLGRSGEKQGLEPILMG